MKVAIIGGGIAGLSAAHYLSKYEGVKIDIYEKDFIGGQAASAMGKNCHIEYSWRIFGQSYDNLNWVIDDVGINNNFVEVHDSCMVTDGKIQRGTLGVFDLAYQLLTMSGKDADPWPVITKLIGLSMMCRERAVTEFDDVNAFEYFDRNPVMQTIMGPYMGLDANKISLSAFMKNAYATRESNKQWAPNSVRISRNPTSISLFEPWVKYLESRGVTIHNVGVSAIRFSDMNMRNSPNFSNSDIRGLRLANGTEIIADKYIFAASLPGILPVLENSAIAASQTVKNMAELKNGLQLYYTFNLYFNRKLGDCPEMIIVDMPWKPIIQKKRQWQVMNQCDKSIADVWNVGFLDYNEGTEIKKILRDCSLSEAQKEGLAQVKNSKYMADLLSAEGLTWDDVYIGIEDWPQFKNDDMGKLISTNPKFSTNVGLEKYMPGPHPSDLPANMYLAGYYCASTNGGASMEASCETGFAAARSLIIDSGFEPFSIRGSEFPIKHDARYLSTIAVPLSFIDNIMYSFGWSSMGEYVNPWIILFLYFILFLLFVYGTARAISWIIKK